MMRRRSTFILAAIIALLPGTALAAEADRTPAGSPGMFRPGFVFSFQDNLKDPDILVRIGAQIAQTTRKDPAIGAAIAQFSNAARQNLAARSSDALARYAASSYASVAGVAARQQFLHELAATDPGAAAAAARDPIVLHGLDGAAYAMPASAATLAHSSALHLLGLEMSRRPAVAGVAGRYAIDTSGVCPALPGHIELKQSGFVVEAHTAQGSRSKLVLFGAVGASRLYLVANEQRYLRLDTGADGTKIAVPDAPSGVFEGDVPTQAATLRLDSTEGRACKLTLNPAA